MTSIGTAVVLEGHDRQQENRDKAMSSSGAGMIRADQLIRVVELTKTGRLIIEFMDGEQTQQPKKKYIN